MAAGVGEGGEAAEAVGAGAGVGGAGTEGLPVVAVFGSVLAVCVSRTVTSWAFDCISVGMGLRHQIVPARCEGLITSHPLAARL